MAIIGTFQKKADGSYTGVVQTPLIKLSAVFRPVESESETGPAFRIFAGPAEFGAAWPKTSRSEREYLSVKLDDPSLAAPIHASLVETPEGENGSGYRLVWSRSRSAD